MDSEKLMTLQIFYKGAKMRYPHLIIPWDSYEEVNAFFAELLYTHPATVHLYFKDKRMGVLTIPYNVLQESIIIYSFE